MTHEKEIPEPEDIVEDSGNLDSWQDYLDVSTRSCTLTLDDLKNVQVPGLTVLWHTNPYRIGETHAFTTLAADEPVLLSRLGPDFVALGKGVPRPLADPHLSREPIRFALMNSGDIAIERGKSNTTVEVNGAPVATRAEFDIKELKQGVVLLLAKRIVLLFHMLEPPVKTPPDLGLVGQSRTLVRAKQQILKVAKLESPVLLRGESGTGKELAARAIYETGSRSTKPFFCINMGAIPPNLAASELFGAKRGAYSGADRNRSGFFQRADTGTLFLDEIGETSQEAQVMLLRVLESGEIQPVGAEKPQKVDVRVIAATDIDLEKASQNDRFKAPLFHRLAGFEIALPPLRERREDIGRLLFHFVQEEMEACGDKRLLDPGPYGKSWLPADLMSRLALCDWPGNVRQLRNLARQLVINSQGHEEAQVDEKIEQLANSAAKVLSNSPDSADGSRKSSPSAEAASYREPWEVREKELLQALRKSRWNLKQASDILGISRSSLYVLIDKCPNIRKAGDLTLQEIEQSLKQCSGNLDAMVDELEVSKRGLKLRMKELGIS
ncbi:MAG: sigma-54-dependent Fis family transcriptional regulator [Proteobacteria bacterium]|nr:sigma-54-dependent Fis family transcriptional regulator [Pseudomonadota bacterium]